jgi:hypothetical protein
MRNFLSALILIALPLIGGIAHAGCLPTLGTDDCFRAGAHGYRRSSIITWTSPREIRCARDLSGTRTRKG